MRALLLALALLAAGARPGVARVLLVGPGQAFASPSAAARVARAGDEVRIAPGTWYDCAIWNADRLTIAASGPGVVMSDRACRGKASFIINGAGVVVRGITFTRIRVADHNGAGIRAQGGDLTVEDCAFINDEVGILTAGHPDAVLKVVRSRFEDVGACDGGRCTGALVVGPWARLEVVDSTFVRPRGGLAIRAQARRVTLRGNHIAGGSGGLVQLALGGPVVLERNVLSQQGGGEPQGAVLLTGGAGPVAVIGNSYRRAGGGGTMILNWSDADPLMRGNHVAPGDTALSTDGSWWHALKEGAHAIYDPARAIAGKVKGKLVQLGARAIGHLSHLWPF